MYLNVSKCPKAWNIYEHINNYIHINILLLALHIFLVGIIIPIDQHVVQGVSQLTSMWFRGLKTPILHLFHWNAELFFKELWLTGTEKSDKKKKWDCRLTLRLAHNSFYRQRCPKIQQKQSNCIPFLIKHDTADHLFLDCFLFFSTTNWDYPSFADDSPL